jgi:hypothetical protein
MSDYQIKISQKTKTLNIFRGIFKFLFFERILVKLTKGKNINF